MDSRLRRRTAAPSLVPEVAWLNSPTSGDGLTLKPAGGPLSAPSLYQGSRRLSGPPLPPNGIPIHTSSLERLNERLEHLAFTPRPEGGPPLETYTTTPSEHGDVVCATQAYVEWFRRTYPASRRADCARLQAPGAPDQGAGGKASKLNRFKPLPP